MERSKTAREEELKEAKARKEILGKKLKEL